MFRSISSIGRRGLLLLLLLPPGAAQAADAASGGRLLGEWHGALEAGGRKLRLDFHITRRADGIFAGTMDSPDQGVRGTALDSVELSGDSLRLVVKRAGASYRGALDAAGATIRGIWSQSGFTFPLDLGREAPPERVRPQDPVKPYPYDEEEVRIENASAHVTLAGTLTQPRGAGPFPAVVLITGSGPQDRDESLLGHRPFLVLADHLTRAGLAVLRCDDRGTGKSSGVFATATTADFAGDVRVEVEYLRSRADVNPKRIGLVGHSEGGLIAPLLAVGHREIAFVVMMAGPGVPGDSLLLLQASALARAAGQPDSVVAATGQLQRQLFAAVRAEQDTSVLIPRLRRIVVEGLDRMPERTRAMGPAFVEGQVAMVSSPWFRWYLQYDPQPTLRKVACPLLAVIGGRDLQVPPRENLPAIRQALRTGGNRDYAVVELPNLNHLFQTCRTGLPDEYGTIEETIAPAALDTMTTWITAHVRP